MIKFELVQSQVNKLYAVYENGVRVKGYIFTGIEDFRNELEFLGFNKPYTITIK